MAMEVTWRSNVNLNQHVIQWDDGAIVFNPLSGETHQLNLMALDALTLLQQAHSVYSLATHMCELYESNDHVSMQQYMQQLLSHLDELGLTSQC
jgi:PqqD family protein of HPr-rel-A system